MDNKKLIQQCQLGNQRAEKELFFRYAGKILSICRRYTPCEAEAKDYMQECFLQLFKQINKYDASKGVFEGWLHRVCTNTILSILRKNSRRIKMVYPDSLPDREEERKEDLGWKNEISPEELIRCIQELPAKCREILNLYAFEGLLHHEIAKHLNISVGTSRSHYTRARTLLKKKIQKRLRRRYERRSLRKAT